MSLGRQGSSWNPSRSSSAHAPWIWSTKRHWGSLPFVHFFLSPLLSLSHLLFSVSRFYLTALPWGIWLMNTFSLPFFCFVCLLSVSSLSGIERSTFCSIQLPPVTELQKSEGQCSLRGVDLNVDVCLGKSSLCMLRALWNSLQLYREVLLLLCFFSTWTLSSRLSWVQNNRVFSGYCCLKGARKKNRIASYKSLALILLTSIPYLLFFFC